MKYTITIILVLLYCFAQFSPPVSAAVSEEHPSPSRMDSGCYIVGIGHLELGQRVTLPGQCIGATCGFYGRVKLDGCPPVSSPSLGCLVADPSQPYPGCCPYNYCSWRGSIHTKESHSVVSPFAVKAFNNKVDEMK